MMHYAEVQHLSVMHDTEVRISPDTRLVFSPETESEKGQSQKFKVFLMTHISFVLEDN